MAHYPPGGQTHPHPRREPRYPGPITLARLEEIFRDCVDFVRRTVWVGEDPERTVTMVYLSGMVRMERVSDYLLRPMAQDPELARCAGVVPMMERMRQGALYNLTIEARDSLDQVVFDLVAAIAVGLSLACLLFMKRMADVAVVTSDNPRTEPPHTIIAHILNGMEGTPAECHVEPDRRRAIPLALSLARKGDTVVLAGKGHETYQEINGVEYHLDEREEIAAYFTR